jgi:hypothetical protein
VHVLVVDGRAEVAGGAGGLEVVEGGEHPAELVGVEQAGAGEDPGVRARAGEVVRCEPPVELHTHGQPGKGLGGPSGKASAPQAGRGLRSHATILPQHVEQDHRSVRALRAATKSRNVR